MSIAKNTAKAAGLVMVITFISKVTGFLREVVLGSKFGTTKDVDAYNMAQNIPMVLFAAIAASIGTTVIPLFSEYLTKKGKDKAFEFINNLLNVIILMTVLFTVIAAIASPIIVKIMAPGFKGDVYYETLKLTIILLPVMIFVAVSNIITGALQSLQHFAVPAMIGIPYNIIIIGTALMYGAKYGIYGVAIATVIGSIVQILIQLPVLLKFGFKYRFVLNLKDESVRKVIILAIPVLIGTSIQVINTYVDRMIASYLPAGSIAALNYANRLIGFDIFSMAIAIVIYPMLSRYFASNNIDEFIKGIKMAVKAILYIMIPVTVGAIIFRVPIIRILFERGAFDERSTYLTSIAFMFYSLGMTANGLRNVLSRGFYSLKDTRTPMINGAIAVLINIGLNLAIVRYLALGGLALSTSVAATATSLMLMYSLRKKIGRIGGYEIASAFVKALIGSAIMGTFAYFTFNMITKYLPDGKIYDVLSLVMTIFIGSFIYFVFILLTDNSLVSYVKKGASIIKGKLAKE
ncbi:murein biosynthesis integral membrane protein MurJ [Thermoanaerobacterium thermosaccharolyticum]|uniref:Probable lipid II flippase MurJ n=2 Tax=Thermoanaerobacterium thermosaccharolyticum TaxID=1517 RepID=D9TTS1_THETC|nr:murein biosynthesis integral membrane protein MurJ [Thermoanaerobacterium thermosaccharolyticum]TCW36530.1 putative peptidoglycan lipid II flippase [Thermohydrogenium kirishiense]ADL69961.1 integral membrane protein MviN [Thermoanaerobacterium thermosaccharolyticum DSM 571]AST57180.1 integral membrane protein [Thermoanaerobacterium thermosaccharolyticum]OXT09215.1 lipid II flippase MurJ [Thermoanaerobacterium thermosaccharolyticum]PHO07487.1 murein biosynthesis integral membrane protein Mur